MESSLPDKKKLKSSFSETNGDHQEPYLNQGNSGEKPVDSAAGLAVADQHEESIIIKIPGLQQPVRVVGSFAKCVPASAIEQTEDLNPSNFTLTRRDNRRIDQNVPGGGYEFIKCVYCKIGLKKREDCRVPQAHTFLPWKYMYLCITIDDSCFELQKKSPPSSASSLPPDQYYIAKPTIARNTSVTQSSIATDTEKSYEFITRCNFTDNSPSCSKCKRRSHSRKVCRIKRKHLAIPHNSKKFTLYIATDKERSDIEKDCAERIKFALSVPPGDSRRINADIESISTGVSSTSMHENKTSSLRPNSDIFTINSTLSSSKTFLASVKHSAATSRFEVS